MSLPVLRSDFAAYDKGIEVISLEQIGESLGVSQLVDEAHWSLWLQDYER